MKKIREILEKRLNFAIKEDTLDDINAEICEVINEMTQLRFGISLCPECHSAAPSGKWCHDCLIKKIKSLEERLKKINVILNELHLVEVYEKIKEALSEKQS